MEFIHNFVKGYFASSDRYVFFNAINENFRYHIDNKSDLNHLQSNISELLKYHVEIEPTDFRTQLVFRFMKYGSETLYKALLDHKDQIKEILDEYKKYACYTLKPDFMPNDEFSELKEKYDLIYTKEIFPDIGSSNDNIKKVLIISPDMDNRIKTMLVMKYGLTHYKSTSRLLWK